MSRPVVQIIGGISVLVLGLGLMFMLVDARIGGST